jgi:hypothetical protein
MGYMVEVKTKSEFAALLGINPAAVSNYIRRRKLTAPALTADGRVNVKLALAQLRITLDGRLSSAKRVRKPAAGNGHAPPDDLADRERQQRIEERDIRLRRLLREERVSRGTYLLASAVEREHGRLIAELVSAIERWIIGDLPALLACDPATRVVIKKAWHQYREFQSKYYRALAMAAPDFEAEPNDEK